jgi:small-conductance mechanosensitive channel
MRRTLQVLFVVVLAALSLAVRPALASPASPGAVGLTPPDVHPAMARIHDRDVFAVLVARNGHSAEERAHHASDVLEHAVDESAHGDVRVDQNGEVAIVYVGDAPVIQLGPEDAAADGDASTAVHAAEVAGHVTDALRAERKRSALAKTVFSFSLFVFSALIVFLALGQLGGLVTRARHWIVSRPSTIPSVQIAGIDVVRPTALRGVALGAIDASRWVFRIGLVYLWVLFALSLFDTTRSYSERLTGYVLAPIYGFFSRLTGTMPVLFIGVVFTLAILLLLRVIALFFEGVARGEPNLSWLPGDLAPPTSVLLRIGIVVVAASVASPLLGGADDGPLSRASGIAVAAIAIALTPIMANAAVGVTVLFGRYVKVGDFVELGSERGVVRAILLLCLTVEDKDGCTVRVPHLRSLLQPTRTLGPMPPVTIDLRVPSVDKVEVVIAVLSRTAETVGIPGRVGLSAIDAAGALYVVTLLSASATARSDFLIAAAKGLAEAGIPLGARAP